MEITPAVYQVKRGVKTLVRPAQTAILCDAHEKQLAEHSVSAEEDRARRAARTRSARAYARENQLTIEDG